MGKLHHFVPRFYLRAWARDEKIYFLQDGEVRASNLKNVGAENYFYRVQELTTEDVKFLRDVLIKESPDGLKAAQEYILEAFTAPHIAKRVLRDTGSASPDAIAEIDRIIVEMNEGVHTSIEEDFRPLLGAMILGDLSFLDNPKDAALFYRCLAVQYLRTNHIKKAQKLMNSVRFASYERIANPLVHILSNLIGLNLYANRKQRTIILVENTTSIPFVTADQPVINMAAGPRDLVTPEKFELYYPLSPTKAMLLLEPASDFTPLDSSVSESLAEVYNLRIAAHSYRQVFSNSTSALQSIREHLPAYLSCF